MRGFKNFLMQGELVVIAVALAIALAFSTLIAAFTGAIITPLVNAAGGTDTEGLGFHVNDQFVDFGAVISAIIYFVIFIAVVYFLIVVPYRHMQARRGKAVFGEPAPTKTCPECLSEDLPLGARKCKHCGSAVAVAAE